MKECRLCHQRLPLEAFRERAGMKDGRRSECTACLNARSRGWHAANKERRAAYDAARYSKAPERHAARRKAWREANRDRFNETHRRWQTANSERKRGWNRRWRRENPEAAAALAATMRLARLNLPGELSPAAVAARVAFWGFRCWMCGGAFEELDHVKPVAAGGANWPANMRPACRSCNRRKSSKWPGVSGLAALRSI